MEKYFPESMCISCNYSKFVIKSENKVDKQYITPMLKTSINGFES